MHIYIPSGDSSWTYVPVRYRCTSADLPLARLPTIPWGKKKIEKVQLQLIPIKKQYIQAKSLCRNNFCALEEKAHTKGTLQNMPTDKVSAKKLRLQQTIYMTKHIKQNQFISSTPLFTKCEHEAVYRLQGRSLKLRASLSPLH